LTGERLAGDGVRRRADISRAFTVSGLSEPSFSSSKAAAPLTTAVAMLVPMSL